ncbi:methyl-accepting chemotaxis protein [Natronorubrum sulfidifaciens]|uniref:Methyl-accepting chemotaxis sensory transducer n=1 Tax=Natronorubrum sulfidifaciens JCM 14089 TaxID=1230460 RepID=L9WGS0_9EURY|nr:methyl-accepting chemotaxis protein [Natronorubrum sulfidifaciens]ELY47508.1 methyl-accepting chemotaxis sensory transducer [Natronorubrum sulfidifaciens JCM 14089]
MTDAASSADDGSPLPGAIQTARPLGFGLAVVVVGLAVVGLAAVGLDTLTPELLGVGAGGVVATGVAAIAIAAVSDARTAPRQRDELRAAIDDVADRTAQLEDGDRDVDFRTDGDDAVADLETSLASLRDQLVASERTDQSLSDLERIVETHAETTGSIADGDLTQRFEHPADHDAVVSLADNSNEMLAEIEETFSTLKSFSGEVVTYSHELNTSMETVQAEGDRTSEALTTVAEDNEEQHEQLQTVAAEMESFSTTIEEIAATASEVADTADRTARAGQEGSRAAGDAIDGMDVIQTETERTLEEIEQLEAEAQQIDDLVDSISDIAEQTNMLALNANIEASRSASGEQGFGAVADEIQNLSERVYDSVKSVEERLETLRGRAISAADEVRTSRDRIEDNVDDVENAANALEQIAELAEQTNNGVQEISAATQQQAAATEEVVVLVENAAETSNATATTSAQVARRAAAQADALSHVAHSATVLTEHAGELNAHLEHYDTESGYELPEARAADDVDPEAVSTADSMSDVIADIDPATSE